MRVLLVADDPEARSDFVAGWHDRRPETDLSHAPGSELSPDQLPALWRVGSQLDVPGDDTRREPLSSTAPLVPDVIDLLTAAESHDVTVVAGLTVMHDGGQGVFTALDLDERETLKRVAPRMTIGAVDHAPLLGLHSRSAQLATTGAVSHDDAQRHDAAIGEFVAEVSRKFGSSPRIARLEGSGTAGGVAFLLAAAGARLVTFPTAIAEHYGWSDLVQDADLTIVLTDESDPTALLSGWAATLGGYSMESGTPLALVGNVTGLPRRHLASIGVSDYYVRAERSYREVGRALAATWIRA